LRIVKKGTAVFPSQIAKAVNATQNVNEKQCKEKREARRRLVSASTG